VTVRDGGETLLSLEGGVLAEDHLSAPDIIRVQDGSQVMTVVAQEAGALGIEQLAYLRERNGAELVVDHPSNR